MIQKTSLHILGWTDSNINSNSEMIAQIGEGYAVMTHLSIITGRQYGNSYGDISLGDTVWVIMFTPGA